MEDLYLFQQEMLHMYRVSLLQFCLSNLFTGERFSTCGRSLLISARDVAHVSSVSPTNAPANMCRE